MFTVEELGQEIAELAVHLDAATHRLLECVRQFDAEGGWAVQGAVSCAHWLSWRIGLDPATAREKVRVARALGNLPAIDAALKSGKLSYAQCGCHAH
jgi:predicted urease superfamily metal-dependent hydrolase